MDLVVSQSGSLVSRGGRCPTPHFSYERGESSMPSIDLKYIYLLPSLVECNIFSVSDPSFSRNTSSFPQLLQSQSSSFHCSKSSLAYSDHLKSKWAGTAEVATRTTAPAPVSAPGADTQKASDGSRCSSVEIAGTGHTIVPTTLPVQFANICSMGIASSGGAPKLRFVVLLLLRPLCTNYLRPVPISPQCLDTIQYSARRYRTSHGRRWAFLGLCMIERLDSGVAGL